MPVRACAVALAAVQLTGCAAGVEAPQAESDPVAAPSASASTSAGATGAPSAAAGPSATAVPSPTPTVRTLTATHAGGQVTGTSGREQVAVGESVVLRISSDVPEEVHVHGYDLQQAVPAGGAAQIPLTASIPGVFEVELHESGKVLFQLRVS